MKKIKLILFSLLILFSFSMFVYADDLQCNNGDIVKIKETGISSAGFNVKMPMCRMEKTKDFMVVGGSESKYFQEAVDAGYDLVEAAQMDAENKNSTSILVPKCADPDAKVEITVTCKKEVGEKDHLPAELQTKTSTTYNNDGGEGCEELTSNTYSFKYKCIKKTNYYTCNGTVVSSADDTCCPTDYHDSNGHCCPSGAEYDTDNCYTTSSSSRTIGIDRKGYGNALLEIALDIVNSGIDPRYRSVSCTTSNVLKCPIYKCFEYNQNISACSPDYVVESTGEDAYCVNPGQGFPKAYSTKVADYMEDKSFNVNKCSNSYSTVDCGYANILIEGAYNKKKGTTVSNDAINIALRLWGAHSTQRGFNGRGIANVIGDSCSEWGYFYGNSVNVFKSTEYYIRVTMKERFYNIAYSLDYIPPSGVTLGSTFDKITCAANDNSDKLGVMCGDNSKYRQGFDLYFNTLIGNSEFKNHLAELFGGAVDTKPDSVSMVVTDESKDETEFVLAYEEFGNIDTEEVVFDCDHLEDVSESDKKKILPYCKTIIYLVDAQGRRLKDSEGHVYDPIGVDKCIKGSGCTTEKFRFAVCKQASQPVVPVYYKIVYYDNTTEKYLKKYQSCANANTNQIMFAFFDDDLKRDTSSSSDPRQKTLLLREDPKIYKYLLSCTLDGACNETGTTKTTTSSDFKHCGTSDSFADRDTTFTSTIRDPSLKCIVNMVNANRSYYDYSDYFGVNSNLCRVFCSDEVSYTFSNRINATAGESFSFDIEESMNADISNGNIPENRRIEIASYTVKNSDHMLSSIISEKRTCVSEIYYSKNFPEEIDWNRIYGITEADLKGANINKINNISQLLTVLAHKSTNEMNRTENLNQVVYDLFNCYFLNRSNFSHLATPRNNVVENTYEYLQQLYGSSNNYGFDDSERICSKTDGVITCSSADSKYKCSLLNDSGREKCIDMLGVQYMFGAEYANNERINQVTLEPDSDSIKTHISNVRYCTGSDCMKYVSCENSSCNPEVNYDYSGFINIDNISYINTPGGYRIPNYNYAMFDVGVNVGLYNNMRFQTKPGNGYVVDITDESEDSSLLTLEPYLYPISKNAITLNNGSCTVIEEDDKNITKRCNIDYVLGATTSTPMIHTFYRKNKIDNFFNEINSSDNRFSCDVDVIVPKVSTCKNCDLSVATIYRNVTPNNLFPNNIDYENTNWATQEGQVAKNIIETTSDQLRGSDSLLDYRVYLSTSQILALREYNSNHKDFANEEIYGCKIVDDHYEDCKSIFLDIFRGETNQSKSLYGTIDEDYNGYQFFGD